MATTFSHIQTGNWVSSGYDRTGECLHLHLRLYFAFTRSDAGRFHLAVKSFLVEDSVIASCNKWRRARGDPELTMADLNPDQQDQTPSSVGP